MKTVNGRRMCALLEKKARTLAGCPATIFVCAGRNTRITVPVHGNRDLKTGLQIAIMKQAAIREDEL